jgi:hypothetical protein
LLREAPRTFNFSALMLRFEGALALSKLDFSPCVYIGNGRALRCPNGVETFEEMMRAGKRREKEGFTTLWQGLISIQEKAAEERMQQKKSQQESCD